MRRLSAADTVELWERGVDRPLPERAALLAQAASPMLSSAQLDGMAIGRRDLSILAMRDATLGSRMTCFVECRHCRARLEFAVDARELVETEGAPNPDQDSWELVCGKIRIRYRLPTGADVAEIARRVEGDTARRELLECCTLGVTRADAAPGTFDELGEAALDALEAALEAHDPVAKVSLATACADCGSSSEFGLDIVPFFAAELSAVATRLLAEVNVLARTYHWREADILALSAVRRGRYVEAALA